MKTISYPDGFQRSCLRLDGAVAGHVALADQRLAQHPSVISTAKANRPMASGRAKTTGLTRPPLSTSGRSSP